MICKCVDCHHEVQTARDTPPKCDWCGAPMRKISDDWMSSDGLRRLMRAKRRAVEGE